MGQTIWKDTKLVVDITKITEKRIRELIVLHFIESPPEQAWESRSLVYLVDPKKLDQKKTKELYEKRLAVAVRMKLSSFYRSEMTLQYSFDIPFEKVEKLVLKGDMSC